MLALVALSASLRKSTSRSTCVPTMAMRVEIKAERARRNKVLGMGLCREITKENQILVGERDKKVTRNTIQRRQSNQVHTEKAEKFLY